MQGYSSDLLYSQPQLQSASVPNKFLWLSHNQLFLAPLYYNARSLHVLSKMDEFAMLARIHEPDFIAIVESF